MNHDDIDALARLLDGDLPPDEAPAEARALSAFAQTLQSSARTPAFAGKADLRAMLVEAAREQASAPSLLARIRGGIDDATAKWRYSMRLAAATGASAMALSTGGVAVAAQSALPGDTLYGVKLALEEGHLLFIGDPVERGRQRLANAAERLEEARLAAEAGDMDDAARALRESDEASRRGAGDIIGASQDRGDPSLLDILTAFSKEQRSRLREITPLLAGEAAEAADDARVALNRIEQRVAVLGGTCGSCAAAGEPGGKGNGGTSGAQDTSSADARDFDFTQIPPADEPFSPCPCSVAPAGPAPADKPGGRDGNGGSGGNGDGSGDGNKPDRKPSDGDKPRPDDEEEPEKPPAEEDPDPVEQASEVVDDVIDEVPTDIPDVPTPDLPPIPPPPDDGDLPEVPQVP